MNKVIEREWDICKNCGRIIILGKDLPEIGFENVVGDDTWVHVEYLSNDCFIFASPSGKKETSVIEVVSKKKGE